MSISLQVIYSASEGSTFDHDYYTSKHFAVVDEHISQFIQSQLVTKGVADVPDQPASVHAIATFVFKDNDALGAALTAAGPVLADLPNFTNVQPTMLIGEVTET